MSYANTVHAFFYTGTVKAVRRLNLDMRVVIVKREKHCTFSEILPYKTIGKNSLLVCMDIGRLIAYYIDYQFTYI